MKPFKTISLWFCLTLYLCFSPFSITYAAGKDYPMESEYAAEIEDECDKSTADRAQQAKNIADDQCTIHGDGCSVGGRNFPVPDFTHCEESETPAPETPYAAAEAAASGPTATTLASGCPCPGGVNIKVDGCNITASCGGSASASIGCPEVRGADPQYPLVKMLSGILVEWNGSGSQEKKYTISSDDAPANPGKAGGGSLGSEYWMVDYTVTISSIDLGKESLFSTGAADHETSKINKLDRNNFNFYFKGDNKHVQVLKPSEIYEAYKNKSDVVQAYLALAGKGFGERPWETYEKFIDAMCDMSRNKSRCIGDLSYKRHKNDGGMEGNVYMGNAQTTVIGVYSEYSSHPCHGATEVSDSGQPAFAIEIESTWCFNFHANYQGFVWDLTKNEAHKGKCCKKDHLEEIWNEDHTDIVDRKWICDEWTQLYIIEYGWVPIGGGESSGDCSACVTVKGYIGPDGKMHKDPYPLSFYQSQALLMTP